MLGKNEIDWYKEILPELEVVFDVGCRNDNIFYSLNPELEIHLFDPRRPSHEMYGNFNKLALGKEKGKAVFYNEYSSLFRRNLIGKKWKDLKHSNFEVEVDTVDNYCLENGIVKIDLLKIDAEGSDLNVILGAAKMLPFVKYIQFEHWNDAMVEQIKEILKDYDVTELGGKPMNYKAKRND